MGRWRLPTENFKDFLIPLPDFKSQCEIVNLIKVKTKEIDDLVSLEQRKIEVLKQYRQSLISEVVTGKIDVRNNQN